MDIDRTLDVAIQVAETAGKLLLDYSKRQLRVEVKGQSNFVSEADKASEALIINKLSQAFPGCSFLAEEGGGNTEGDTPLKWIIDPLDGTTNYLRGYPHYAVSIAATWNNTLFAGVIHAPTVNETFSTGLGRGSFLNGRKMKVSNIRRVPDSLLSTGFSYDTGDKLRRSMKMFQTFQDNGQTIRRPGSAALDLAYVAAGRFDGFWESGLKPWDCAAGVLMIQESGGKVTNFADEPYELGGNDILSSNGVLHTEMLRRLRPFA